MNIEEFIERGGFKSLERQKNGVLVNCPAHDDKSPSLSVRQFGDQIVLKCFAGCEEQDILEALKLNEHDIRPPRGCTIEQYAEKIGLPVEFLLSFNIRQATRSKIDMVAIPWVDETGKEINCHYRIAVRGKSKFRWDKGKPVRGLLYNIDCVDPKEDGSIVICEGESDVHTLAFHGFQAVGIPGAGLWENELLNRLDGFEKLYFIIEPDRGGDVIFEKLSKLDGKIKEKIYFPQLDGFKDPNQLYCHDSQGFFEKFEKALENAASFEQLQQSRRQKFLDDQYEICQTLAASDSILDVFAKELPKLGLVGDSGVSKLIYLCLTSRLFERPCSAYIEGPSAAGKSFNIATVLKFFPDSVYLKLTAMSEKSLAYEKEDMRHRFIVIFEESGLSSSEFGEYLIRTLLSEGEIRYKSATKVGNKIEPIELHLQGPIGLLTTTTKVGIHPENATRVIFAPVDDSKEQTEAIFRRLADETEYQTDLSRWKSLQSWMEGGERRVTIPFGSIIAENTIPSDVRLRRDFTTFLTLIKAHALLHQKNRQRAEDGKIIATIDDYSTVYELVAELIGEQVGKQIPKPVRDIIDAAAAVLTDKSDDFFSNKELVIATGLNKSTISRNVRKALKHGLVEYHETSKKKNLKFVIGTPLVDDNSVFPSPARLREIIGAFGQQSLQLCNYDPKRLESQDKIVAQGFTTNESGCNQGNQGETGKPLVAVVAHLSESCSGNCNQNYSEYQQVKPSVAQLRSIEGSNDSFGNKSELSALPCEAVDKLKHQVGFNCSVCDGTCLDAANPVNNPIQFGAKPTTFTYNNEKGRLRIE